VCSKSSKSKGLQKQYRHASSPNRCPNQLGKYSLASIVNCPATNANQFLVVMHVEANIVAAFGDRAEAGLPGVGRVRSNPQNILDIDGFQLTNILPPFEELVDQSFWNSRGWTYQERLLSIRMLVFTEQQLFFRCQEMECCEDVRRGRANQYINISTQKQL
jgi:hypothetical protein